MSMSSDDAVLKLATEVWRLKRRLPENTAQSVHQSLGRMDKLIAACGIEVLDPVGTAYSHGLTAEVIEWEENPEIPPGKPIVGETISPIISREGQVINHGQVIIHIHSRSEI